MRRDKLDIRTTTYGDPEHPWHGKTVYQIMLKAAGTRDADCRIKGCPLGSGLSEEAAYRDLRDGIRNESSVDIGPLTEWSEAEVVAEVTESLEGYDRVVSDPASIRGFGEGEDPAEVALQRIRSAHEALVDHRRKVEEEAAARRKRMWRVWLRHERTEYCCVTVEADTETEARKAALDVGEYDCDWEPVECNEPYITEVERMEEQA